ncbi:MAG TPA: hypothetical protein VIL74_09100 [Pyrinomonadaceae bacterium]|jgi:hypothetical protein
MTGNPLLKRLFSKIEGASGFVDPETQGGVRNPNVMYANGDGDEPARLDTSGSAQYKKLWGNGMTRSGETVYDADAPQAPQDPVQQQNDFDYGISGATRADVPYTDDDSYQSQNAPAIEQQKQRSQSAMLLDQINQAEAAPVKRENGFWNRLGSGLWNGLKMWGASGAQGGLGGLVGALATGGAGFAISPDLQGDFKKRQGIQKLWNQYGAASTAEKDQQQIALTQARVEDIPLKRRQEQDEFQQKMDFNRGEQQRKIDDRQSRERTARMTQVAGMFKSLAAYDPADPKFAELTKALGDVELPITPKDAKKKIDLKQDQRTGEWTTILTDPVSGAQEARPVVGKDGKPLRTTPTVVMQGEYGLLRQNDQQNFTREENDKIRRDRLRQWAIQNKVSRAKFKADLDAKVAAAEMSQAQADAALADFPTDLQ